MNKESSKKIVLVVFVFIVTVVALIGFTYALFRYSRVSSNNASIIAGKLEFGYIEETNGINLQNAMPVSDEVALNTTDSNNYFDFYVTYNVSSNATIDYEVDIENITNQLSEVINNNLAPVDSSKIKVALENRADTNNDSPMLVNPTYFSELERYPASNSKKGYILYKTSITGNSKDYYRLYMWIPEIDTDGNEISIVSNTDNFVGNQAFSIKINIQALGKNEVSR